MMSFQRVHSGKLSSNDETNQYFQLQACRIHLYPSFSQDLASQEDILLSFYSNVNDPLNSLINISLYCLVNKE